MPWLIDRDMIPIQELLNRIRWDPGFGVGRITIGYYDRMKHRVIRVPLENIDIEPGNHFFFIATEADGTVHEVPFHRVREVRRNGERIWHRDLAGEPVLGRSTERAS